MDALKTGVKKVAKDVVQEAMSGKDGNRGSRAPPEDPEAYAKKVADAIKADIRCANACLFESHVSMCVCSCVHRAACDSQLKKMTLKQASLFLEFFVGMMTP